MIKTVSLVLTEQFWFKFKNKCRYYNISMNDAAVELLLKFTESTELDYLFSEKQEGSIDGDK